MNKTGFSYEKFCEYVRNRMSIIYEGDQGEYLIMEETEPLQEFGIQTEEETLRYIYDNNLFEQLEEVIRKSPAPYIYSIKEPEDEFGNDFEEDDWELEP